MEMSATTSGWFSKAIVILLLATLGAIQAFTGLAMLFGEPELRPLSGPQSGQTPPPELSGYFFLRILHTFVGLSIIGIAALHIWQNRRSLKLYLKKIFLPAKTGSSTS
ncbi:hypothetical protein Pogu_1247 [Pyrobaculum oguniense TE7]|uniref:DUF4405 domain-containing protein n=1 Tax=Pyrobaculum oguniense (strain DSM 13380 / JCM 10595 / TE7) TaxID=698757 RepID=H6Q8W9_PYROT|nr:hypothetical protein Pogu_1247 [Pyrobaculum oguniense TE7]